MKSIMTHIVAGYPNLKESKKIAEVMIDSGVSFIEIQIPFSDPIADGKTIMKANQKALENGTTIEDALKLMKDLSINAKKNGVKLLFMSYFNVIFKYGLEKFCKKSQEIGCYGLIIPDMPINEEKAEHYLEICNKYKLNPIQIISPITKEKRIKEISKQAKGFIYCVSRTGTTGESKKIQQGLDTYIKKIRKYTGKTKLALGFGISSKKQIEQALKHADIAVIGSKIINLYDECGLDGVGDFFGGGE